mgnify:CR=1 FL=1
MVWDADDESLSHIKSRCFGWFGCPDEKCPVSKEVTRYVLNVFECVRVTRYLQHARTHTHTQNANTISFIAWLSPVRLITEIRWNNAGELYTRHQTSVNVFIHIIRYLWFKRGCIQLVKLCLYADHVLFVTRWLLQRAVHGGEGKIDRIGSSIFNVLWSSLSKFYTVPNAHRNIE